MSNIATAIVAKLTSSTAITNLIGKRVYPSYDRQSDHVYPLAVYQLEVSNHVAFDGSTGVADAILEIAAVAKTYGQATTLGTTIAMELDGARGTWGGVEVQGCFLQDDGERDDIVTDPTTDAVICYVKNLRFDITFNT